MHVNHVIDVARRILTLQSDDQARDLRYEIDRCLTQLKQAPATGTPDPKLLAATTHAAAKYAIKVFHETTGRGVIEYTENSRKYAQDAVNTGIATNWLTQIAESGVRGGNISSERIILLTLIGGFLLFVLGAAVPLQISRALGADTYKYPNLVRAAVIGIFNSLAATSVAGYGIRYVHDLFTDEGAPLAPAIPQNSHVNAQDANKDYEQFADDLDAANDADAILRNANKVLREAETLRDQADAAEESGNRTQAYRLAAEARHKVATATAAAERIAIAAASDSAESKKTHTRS